MTPITEVRNFDAIINQFDTTDPVVGGSGGVSNNPVVALANRTRYLYDYKNGFTGVSEIAASTNIDTSFLRKLIYINASVNITVSLASIANFTIGQRLFFKCKNAVGKCVSIVPAASELLKDGSATKNIWLYDGEEITLVARSLTEWEILGAKGNFDTAGNDGMVRRMPKNSFVADGTNYSRADYARLWEAVSIGAIDDVTWLNDPVSYRQLFSGGDGLTTFRIPDMRSMVWKGLDLGRGLSLGRFGINAGAYEPDAILVHSHTFQANGDQYLDNNPTGFPLGRQNNDNRPETITTSATGGPENLVKTVGFIPIIYF